MVIVSRRRWIAADRLLLLTLPFFYGWTPGLNHFRQSMVWRLSLLLLLLLLLLMMLLLLLLLLMVVVLLLLLLLISIVIIVIVIAII